MWETSVSMAWEKEMEEEAISRIGQDGEQRVVMSDLASLL